MKSEISDNCEEFHRFPQVAAIYVGLLLVAVEYLSMHNKGTVCVSILSNTESTVCT